MMSGRIWVESEVGRGSTFDFTIIAEAVSCSFSSPIESGVQPLLSGKRLLIVDDNATNCRILTLQAQSWGMITHVAKSGLAALNLCQEEAFDVAILDMQMPQMDGLTLATKIRQHPCHQKLPVVMLTSLNRQAIATRLPTAVNFTALNKPIKQSQLYNVLVQALSSQAIPATPVHPVPPIDCQLSKRFPLRILLAEDHSVNQKVALYNLQKMGYRAEIASNGLEVLQALRYQSYDVVLMDVQMPEMDGLTATKLICQEWLPHERPQIIAMTANALEGARQLCLDAGMDDYISKPLQVKELVQALEKCQPRKRGMANRQGIKSDILAGAIDSQVLDAFRASAGKSASVFLAELIDCYLKESTLQLQIISAAVEQGDGATLQQQAHILKSSSSAVGATNLAKLCRALEVIGSTGIIEGVNLQVSELWAEYKKVEVALLIERQQI